MMHVVICDDEPCFQEAVVNAVKKWMCTSGHSDIRCTVFSSSEDLLERWSNGLSIDLLFLDIEIPGEISGMALAQKIRDTDHNLPIVFITNYLNYVYEGYVVNAMRFLTKPVNEDEVFTCMDISYRHFQLLSKESFIVNAKDQRIVLRHSEIIYIEARSHYLFFHLSSTDEIPSMRAKIGDIIGDLPSSLFAQCHRSFIVNLLYIRRFTKNSIIMSNNRALPVSLTYFSSLYKTFNRFYQEE